MLDFVIFAGDPDEGAPAIPSERALAEYATLKDQLRIDPVAYGAIIMTREKQPLSPVIPDPILKLITKTVRTVSYVMDGEVETVLFNESEHGFMFERANDHVRVSLFRGPDPFDPDERIVDGVLMPVDDFASQIIQMGERIVELTRLAVPDRYQSDEYCGGALEFLDIARTQLRAYRLERERLRRR